MSAIQSSRDPVEVRRKRDVWGMRGAAASLAFILSGLWLLTAADTGLYLRGVGIFCLVIALLVGVTVAKVISSPVVLSARRDGFEIDPARGAGFIRWEDIEDVDVLTMGRQRFVGVRLRDTSPYLASVEANETGGDGSRHGALRIIDRLTLSSSPLSSVKAARSLLEANMRSFGYHFTFGGPGMSHSPAEIAALIRTRVRESSPG